MAPKPVQALDAPNQSAAVLIGKLARDEYFDHDLQVVRNVHKFVAQGGKNDAAYAGTAQRWIERIWIVLRTHAQRRAMGRSNAESQGRWPKLRCLVVSCNNSVK